MSAMEKTNSSSSTHSTKSTERSPLLGPSRSASASRSPSPLYNAAPISNHADLRKARKPVRYVSQPFSSSKDDVEAQASSTTRRGARVGSSEYDQDDTIDELDDHAPNPDDSTANMLPLPFPSQKNPAKPLRPKNYRTQKNITKLKSFAKRNHGLLLLACSMLFFSTMNLFFKLLTSLPPEESQPITALEIIFIRMSITWVGCIAFMLATGVENPILGPKGVRALLALRGFSGFFGLFGIYYSLQYLSLSDATVITFLGPLATGYLGYLALGEKFTWKEVASGFVSLGGVVLIARPAFIFGRKLADEDPEVPAIGDDQLSVTNGSTQLVPGSHELGSFLVRGLVSMVQNATVPDPSSPATSMETSHHKVSEAQRLIAVGLALLGVCGGAGAYITIRAIGRRASATHSVAYFALYSSIVSMALMKATGTEFVLPKSYKWCALLVCIGLFGLIAQILLAMGLQREKAGRAVSATYLQIVFASFYQLFFLHVPITPLSGLGIAIIMASAIFVTMSK